MNVEDQQFEILIHEIEHADRQISSYMALQLKIVGIIFSALAISIGWIFSQKRGLCDSELSVILIIILFINTFLGFSTNLLI